MLPSPVTSRAVRRAAIARGLFRALLPLFELLVFAVVFSVLASGCFTRRSETLRVQCPESPRTYCPAQHPGDTVSRGRR